MAGSANIPVLAHFEGATGEAREERFWSKVQIGGPMDCWDWTLTTAGKGYGRFKVASYVTLHANRVAWALHHRREPGDLIIRHVCDRPICCNPAHLVIGTHQDNTDDKMARGRWRGGDQAGERNPRAKLREEHLPAIVAALQAGKSNKAIASELPVDHALISRIRVGLSWAKQTRALGWKPAPQFKRKRA